MSSSLTGPTIKMINTRKDRRGGVAVEFALIMPLMTTMLLGIIEYGLYFNEKQHLQNILIQSCGEEFYEDAEYLFGSRYGTCIGCSMSLEEDDKFYYCILRKDHKQYTNFFPASSMPQNMNMEAVKRKDEEKEDTDAYY